MSNPEVIKAYADLAWPVLAAVLLFLLLPTIVRVAKSRAFSVKFGDMELSVKDASEQLLKRVEDLQQQVLKVQSATTTGAGSAVERGESRSPTSATRKTILWVDDNPTNNASEIANLQSAGYEVVTAKSTQEALALLNERKLNPDLIFSDMGRREGLTYRNTAGLDLIRAVRALDPKVPIYIYTSNEAVKEFKRAVEEAKGNGITASTTELFRMIRSA
jgi:CheY-like chemotaxis protein